MNHDLHAQVFAQHTWFSSFLFFLALLRSGCAVDGEYGRGNRSQEAWVLYCGVSVTGGDVGLSGFAFI